ncbi:MAG TPA: N-6 DNA methylase, partial [Ktedonobacterales bacterium]
AVTTTAGFDQAFETYLRRAREARVEKQHHDKRREIFLQFLKEAFGVSSDDVQVELFIRINGTASPTSGMAQIRKGWIDAVFQDIIFEFKLDLTRERETGLRELRDYLSTLPNGAECVGLLTDGLAFEAYTLDDSQPAGLRKTDGFSLDGASAEAAYLWLDAYLLRQKLVPPTAEDIVRRFGQLSPTFAAAARQLTEALRVFDAAEAGAAEVKRQQWAFHLARVYGSADVSSDELFVRHTYLCQFAKLLAYTARFGPGDAIDKLERVIDGRAFEALGISNIGEHDFFAWVLEPGVRELTLPVFRRLVSSFAVYDLTKLDQDLLKQLYQNLVDPGTRHDLGEFYTPDWLAQLTLREIGYGPGQSLLDPSCGSGTFLFSAIRLLAERGVTGPALVDFALNNIMGLDVHPLAVTIAKINYMLAILPHLAGGAPGLREIPISMANSLQMPDKSGPIAVIRVKYRDERAFEIPVHAAERATELNDVLARMDDFARSRAANWRDASFTEFANYALGVVGSGAADDYERGWWAENARRLAQQIGEGRDSIWAYVLRNTTRPLFLQRHKFDVVAGNPPWLSYRYIKDAAYQREVKALAEHYGLIASGERKLTTQIELATLFFEHCWSVFAKTGGTVAFVMPRSVLTGAKQHQAFQAKGFSRALDFREVAPLFNVPTCVLIRHGDDARTEALPTTTYRGALPQRETPPARARELLSSAEGVTTFAADAETVASPFYYARVRQGATIVPRTLSFVTSAQPGLKPGERAYSQAFRTDPDVIREAKAPWKDLTLEGHLDGEFLYATLLSKQLVPFGVRRFHLVALPIMVGRAASVAASDGAETSARFLPMSLDAIRDTVRLARSANEWFQAAEDLWRRYRKSADMDLWNRYNYQNGVIAQSPEPGYFVLYNASGSNIAAAVVATAALPLINGAQPIAFVADHTAYWYRARSLAEARYLCALLNAGCVNLAIKPSQTAGTFGERHVHRRPFEVCA